jgi:transcriptional regulator with XRE-family HTH domain
MSGLTQEEFRIQFNQKYHRNYTPSAISRFENNKRIPETAALIDFADFFGVTVDMLLGRSRDFGEFLSKIRMERNLSIEGLSSLSGIPKERIIAWEHGDTEQLTQLGLESLCSALGIDSLPLMRRLFVHSDFIDCKQELDLSKIALRPTIIYAGHTYHLTNVDIQRMKMAINLVLLGKEGHNIPDSVKTIATAD